MAQAVPGSGYSFSKLQPKQRGCWRAGARQLAGPHRTERAWGLQHQTGGKKKNKNGQLDMKGGKGKSTGSICFIGWRPRFTHAAAVRKTLGALTSGTANVAFSSYARRHWEGQGQQELNGSCWQIQQKFILHMGKAALTLHRAEGRCRC